MSGHSKWSKVKHQKGVQDAKRGQLFSKLAQEISAAAKANPDPGANPPLKALIEKARSFNMPKENIERAVERAKGAGASSGEQFVLEAYAKNGEGIIVEGTTDNKNRTLAELRHVLLQHGARLVGPGGVAWNFEGEVPRVTKPGSPEFHKLLEELRNHQEVEKVLTDAR